MIDRLYASPALLLTLTAFMWATNAIIGQLAVGEITPFALVFLRWAFVAAAMWALYGRVVRAGWSDVRRRLLPVIFMALAGFTGFNTLFYIAAQHTGGLNIGILQGSMPVMVLLGAWAAYRDRITLAQGLGVIVTLIGAALVAARGDLAALAALAFNKGDLIMALAALLYSAYAVALRMRPQMPGPALFALFSVIALVSAFPLAAWEALQPGYQWPSLEGWALTVWVAIFPSCLGQLFFLRGVDMVGPGRAGVYINLVPVFTAVLAVLILGETFHLFHGAALVLVVGGIWLTQKPSGVRGRT